MTLPNLLPMSPVQQLLNWIARPYPFLDDCAQKYGERFTLRLWGFPPLVMTSNPQDIKQIFSRDTKKFDAGKSNALVRPLLGDNSLVLLDGDRHKHHKKLLMPPFHGKSIKSYADIIANITDKATSEWEIDKPFLIHKIVQDITLEVILSVVFGLSEGERYQQLKPLLTDMLDLMGSPWRSSFLFLPLLQQDWGAWSPWGNIVRMRKTIYRLLQAEIDQRRIDSNAEKQDVLSLMLLSKDEQGNGLTDDELMTLLVGGHETTASTLAWAFYWIHKQPQVKQKLLEEIDHLAENSEPLSCASLPYLTAICNETLRIYPVVPFCFARITKFPQQIMGQYFPTDTALVACTYLLHHREDLYPQSRQFKPERFLERQFLPHEFIPFGGGDRRCLGYALAELEIKVVIARILKSYELYLANDETVVPKRRGVTIATSSGVPLVLKSRRQILAQRQSPLPVR